MIGGNEGKGVVVEVEDESEVEVLGVAGNGSGKHRKKIPMGMELLKQYAYGLHIPVGQAQRGMNALGFVITT